MTPEARRAIHLIRECVAADRYALSIHFAQRMAERGIFWLDVLAIIEEPNEVRSEGMDKYNRPKWIVTGTVFDDDEVELVCAIEFEPADAEFITIYWED